MQAKRSGRIGIYVRESRDDYGENLETIENQKGLLLEYASKCGLGDVAAVYEDDNVSGSGFERQGITRLREDVLNSRIDIVLVKDLSRLGRNNAKTLQFLDFLEERGIRVLSSDGRYDSLLDNDIVGIETWANERYIRDISRKIRSSLRFKIRKGEYVGHAPFGYRKLEGEGNHLSINEEEADIVRHIYRLYLSGFGYTAIASLLDVSGLPSPQGGKWNRITVRRILVSSVYIGDTVQGISERVSFKSKKTRRLPREEWVVTERTHEAIISAEEFRQVQRLREGKGFGRSPHKSVLHTLGGLIRCGGCGSVMYARKTANGVAYLCGNYCRNGKLACSSHRIGESELVRLICDEMEMMFANEENLKELKKMLPSGNLRNIAPAGFDRLGKQLQSFRRQQEMLYKDRLECRISEQLFEKTNKGMEERMKLLESRLAAAETEGSAALDPEKLIIELKTIFKSGRLTNEIAAVAVGGITVFDAGDQMPQQLVGFAEALPISGAVVIDFRMK